MKRTIGSAAVVWFLLAVAQAVAADAQGVLVRAVQPFVNDHTVAGAVVLVANQDRVLCVATVGDADRAAQRPMRADNMFWIASMTKPMTATALMMLVDEGKLRVSDAVEKYLPEFRGQMLRLGPDKPLQKPRRPITVKDLLSHTSGLMTDLPMHVRDAVPLAEAVRRSAALPLKFEPGSKYEYCNPGINTVGRIIEVVSGMPYAEFMQQRLFGPLGMRDTTFWPTPAQIARLATAYKENAAKTDLEATAIYAFTPPLSNRRRTAIPAGGLFSTANDVSLFCRMVLNGGTYQGRRYLSPAAVQQMTSNQVGNLLSHGKSEAGYGFCWTASCKAHGPAGPGNGGVFGHGGAYGTYMSIDPQRRLITVLMVQRQALPGPQGAKLRAAVSQAAADIAAQTH
jgi:CubicO group peptidase (beta-lactamase class C family)